MQSTISELDSTRLNKEDIAKQFNEIENKKNKEVEDTGIFF